MSSTTSETKGETLAFVQALIAGTQKHFPNGTFTIGNTAYTTASLCQLFQSLVTAMTSQNAAQANAKDAVAATKGLQAQVDPVILNYKRYVLATFANATPTLADFGIPPPKVRTPRTAEQKAASAAKAAATRAARGTAGKKQKAAVKGNVAGITVTPITMQIVPSPSAQPASPAPSAAPTGTASK
jgi:hypothetical protein